MNESKKQDKRFWEKWYKAGAVAQKPGPISIVAVSTRFDEQGNSMYQVLSLGEQVVHSGSGWKVTDPTHYATVASKPCRLPGETLPKIPANAVPKNICYPS